MIAVRARLAAALGVVLLSIAGFGCDEAISPMGAAVSSLEISASPASPTVGDTIRLTVVARSAAGDRVPVPPLQWSSGDTTVATVVDGLVTARRAGTALIVVSSWPARDEIDLAVNEGLGPLVVRPTGVELLPGRGTTVLATDRWGNALSPLPVYSSSDTGVVRVSAQGEVAAGTPGEARITVRHLGRTVEVPVLVHAAGYTVTPLGGLGGSESQALGINEHGQVVGRATTADGTWRGFVWEEGRMREIAFPGAVFTEAVAINDRGVVVGNAGTGSPWRWKDGVLTPLAIVPEADDHTRHSVTDVNALGQISGYTTFGYGRHRSGEAFIWHEGAARRVGGGTSGTARVAEAEAINDQGVAVGRSGGRDIPDTAVGWGTTGAFDAAPHLRSYSWAVDVNGPGEVLANSISGYDEPRGIHLGGPYLWEDGTVRFLGLPAGEEGSPAALNDLGEVVGSSSSGAFLWRDDRSALLDQLLDDPEWTITAATDINDRGQIVGYGRHRDTGATGALLLSPQ